MGAYITGVLFGFGGVAIGEDRPGVALLFVAAGALAAFLA
jgi:hypothetical protein